MVVTLRPPKRVAEAVAIPSGRQPALDAGAVLEVRNLSVMYGAMKAVDDVSFQVRAARFLASSAQTVRARRAPSAPLRA